MAIRLLKSRTAPIPGPVFYDGSGKRWHHVIETACVITLVITAILFWVVPKAVDPLWKASFSQGRGFPRQFLSNIKDNDIPVIGEVGDNFEGVLSRIVRIDVHDGITNLTDPFTGEVYRQATDDEKETIGNKPYAVEHFGKVPDRQLILTFDDGPDSAYTPEILDILGREHVPATFFVIGANIIKNIDILQRAIREGHIIANHTLFHINFDQHGDIRNREELIGNDRIIRAAADYSTRVFRMPYGDPDHNALAVLQAQQLGYIHVDADLDTRDWSYSPGVEIPVPPLDGRGHVVLLHDGGGDREATVHLVEKLIKEAKQQGYTFSTVAPLLPEKYTPKKEINPTIADHATLYAFQAVWVIPGRVLGWLFWIGVGSLSTISLMYLFLALINHRRQRKYQSEHILDTKLPHASVVLAAYNEGKVIERTLDALRASDYPQSKLEVIVVNDGSKDNTGAVLEEYAKKWPQLNAIHQDNRGKSAAINNGIAQAKQESGIIVTLDGDTLFEPQTIRLLVRHFMRSYHRKQVGAVAGHIKVGNRRNILTAWQSLEYISGICVNRLAEGAINAIAIVPGACSAWSRRALEEIGGLSEDTLAEDADATLQMHRLGYKVLQENTAVAYTEAPESIRTLAKQRLRWTYGNIQVLWKHRSMLLRPKYGLLGMVSLPYALLSLVIPLVFLPPTVVIAAMSLASGNWVSVALFAAFVMALHLVTSTVAIIVARERAWHLLIVPVYRLIYEPLRAYLLYASLIRILKGKAMGWNKLERLNSAVLHTTT